MRTLVSYMNSRSHNVRSTIMREEGVHIYGTPEIFYNYLNEQKKFKFNCKLE